MASLFELFTLGLFQFCVVRQGEIRVIERRGKFARLAHPGVTWLASMWGYGETIGKFRISRIAADDQGRAKVFPRVVDVISTRMQVDDYPKESVITKDKATVEIDAVVYYKVMDPEKAVYALEDYVASLQKLVQSALRDACGQYDLDELLVSREQINVALRVALDEATDPWGIKVDRVDLKDIDLGPFGKILAEQRATETRRRTAVTEAEGLKQASILRAQGEGESAVLEAEASRQAMVLRAKGEQEAALLRAEAEAQSIVKLREAEARGYESLRRVFDREGGEAFVQALQVLKAAEVGAKLADGTATKLFLPADMGRMFGLTEHLSASMQPDRARVHAVAK
jgi:regulator of protease activity HflC (stomatin/prohibitin superfamily)